MISPQSTFSQMGMDSIMAVEINQLLNKSLELLLTAEDIRRMTFPKYFMGLKPRCF